jgi:multisubunit Na+/H+ antiporter MnhB subunit
MYPDGGVTGIVAVAPVILFLVSYLVYTQAPKHRHRKSDIRAPSDARAKSAQNASETRDVRM